MTNPDARLAEVEARTSLGPERLAAKCELLISELLAQREAAASMGQRRQLSSRIRASRFLLRWAKSRVGYGAL